MEMNVFMDRSLQPDGRRLAHALGENAALWETIENYITQKHGDFTKEWKFYNAKSGWILKALLKKRNLFFLTPLQGFFRVAFVFGEKAVSAVEKSDLPEALKNELRNARKYAEGRGLRIEVKYGKEVEHVKKLIDIKVSN